MEREFYSGKELAVKLGASTRVIEKWRYEGRIPGQVKIGGMWRYRIVDVEKRLLNGDFLLPKNQEFGNAA